MKPAQKKIIRTTAAAVAFAALIFISAGCGGGGSAASFSSAPKTSLERTSAVPTASPVVPADSQKDYSALVSLQNFILNAPQSAFVELGESLPGEKTADRQRKHLEKLIEMALAEVDKGDFNKASKILEKQFMPRVDGCNGGKPENDIVNLCPMAEKLYNAASDVTALISGNGNSGKVKTAGRVAAAMDLDSFKIVLTDKLNTINNIVTNAPADVFTVVEGGARELLLNILDVAMLYVETGDIDIARAVMENEFYPLMDGGDGGDPSDDFIVASFYSAADYSDTISTIHDFVQTASLTAIDITPGFSSLLCGEAVTFKAVCTYSDMSQVDCTSEVAWMSSDPGVGNIGSDGGFSVADKGVTTVNAFMNDIYSGTSTVEALGCGTFMDFFNDGSLNLLKWSDIYNSAAITPTVTDGRLVMTGPQYTYGEIVPAGAHYVDYEEEVAAQIDLDMTGSSGLYYVQGFGIMDGNRTGIAVGITGGTLNGKNMIYYSTPSSYGTIDTTATKARIRIVYKNGTVKLYVDDMSAPVRIFNAYLDGRYVTFFMYSTAINGSVYNAAFDNFWSNQSENCDVSIKLENLTRPFAPDGSGTLVAGDTYKMIMTAPAKLANTQATFIDPATMGALQTQRSLRETTPGVYEFTGTVPTAAATKLAVTASSDRYSNVMIYTRKIAYSAVAARIAAKTATAEKPTKPLPDFLLPREIR